MDPYSPEGELVHIHSAFHQAQYQKVVDFDTSSFSQSNALPTRVLKLRAKAALGKNDEVIKEVGKDSTPDLEAVKILAQYGKKPSPESPAVKAATELAKKQPDNLNVQICCGTVLADAGLVEEALQVLAKHQGSLDAVALIVQIHLQQNRLDLAKKEATNARKWAQDSLLVNIAESWVGMREGGEKYQAAYYVFEELAQAPSTQSISSLVGQAIAELHLGRLPEAEAAMQQAIQLDPESVDAVANTITLNTILGKSVDDELASLKRIKPGHQILTDLTAKREEFERASARYNPKFEA